ncbi:PREDICTED: probable serine/threonine-protein kinase At1g09600 [Tarenaya hassleriana]|uniref:probable serine/threonine-protein kinase At1g09600 n=1 Tax=Tarenaya hassleriana TaxID=28532 RepID=UPI00053C5B83|nr:PREDICTED: probable serine/threonine-protein kinase At1g09600 [Tarenaya hassleriana]
MGCICSKGIQANGYVENNHVKDEDLPKNSKKQSVSTRNAIVESEEEGLNGNEATLRLIPNDSKNACLTPVSSDEAEKKDGFERKSSKSVFQRRPAMDIGSGDNVGVLQPRMTRIASISNGERGAQVIAGWPSWLAAVAGEAINGWIPRKADSFEKLEKIGQGTYSSVYKARDLESNQIVALKKVRFANMDPESVRFMAREIIILRRLDHPNVMKLEGVITSRVSGSLYLVFEYMDHDLSGLASSPGIKFSEAQIKCYMKQLLHGLEHCHSHGVLHRDIKGSNLLLDRNNNLKIGDFGLANFFRGHQKQPLTSRVVTLWYRPPELLLGATDYGVTVDLWSTGCILAELFTGKPIMPGRTEVEQLHKIFKLCGSPSEEYWKRSKLPHATIFKPQQRYQKCVAETFKDLLPSSALALLEVLLAVEPNARGTASSALQSEFFTMKPFPSDPSSLPRYQPRKEYDAKFRDEEARRKKGASGKGQNESKRAASRESKAVPAPDANAELLASIQKRQVQNNVTSVSENFNCEEDAGAGFRIQHPNGTALGSSVNMNGNGDGFLGSSSHSKELRMQRSFVQRGAAQLSRFSNPVATRGDGSRFGSVRDSTVNPNYGRHQQHVDGDQSSENGDWSQRLLDKPKAPVKDEYSCGTNQGFDGKNGRMHYSGPLIPAGGNLDEMLKEHERQIRLAVRRARVDKTKKRDDENGQSQSLLLAAAANGR